MAAGITYPEYTDMVESVSKIKEFLPNVTDGHWAILLGESKWCKLDKVGIIYKTPISVMPLRVADMDNLMTLIWTWATSENQKIVSLGAQGAQLRLFRLLQEDRCRPSRINICTRWKDCGGHTRSGYPGATGSGSGAPQPDKTGGGNRGSNIGRDPDMG